MSKTAEIRLQEIVEDAARTVTDDTGRFHKTDFESEVRKRLSADDLEVHIQAEALDKLAHGLVRGFGERRSPNPRRRSGMFHPQGILKLGSGKWVWMESATPTDLLEWGRLASQNLARVAQAETIRQDYVAERLDAFRLHSDLLLGELERIVFGYVHNPNADPDFETDAD
ncbi:MULTISPECIES: hypothetical protein [unclassified Kitasatospora]|uniref:hypothetical protein n=1 Tax=unclassified Kitasatospora TaxID=2633591 RepID=UPI00070BF2E6|nr:MULTISPECIES: hypothetical protein [unclassified Kitasatospora]KQV20951.1 hypothetical protein ASC99_20835 [Kitasatospora sp. Root107]KRB60395.1 hypothetical protein ASE03_12345 [Kitasatospora sp. Root187]